MRGVIGSGLPRGEMVGTATLTYEGAGLVCELTFGRSPHPADRGDALLQRADKGIQSFPHTYTPWRRTRTAQERG